MAWNACYGLAGIWWVWLFVIPPGEIQASEAAFLGAHVVDSSDANVKGAFVSEVFPGYAAADAGLRQRDIVTAIGDVRVDGAQALIQHVKTLSAGNNTTFTITRRGKVVVLPITFGGKAKYSLVLRQKDPPRVPGAVFQQANGATWKGNYLETANFLCDGGDSNIAGNYQQFWTALLGVDLDKKGVLNVNGDVSLAGILYVRLEKTVPKLGDRFEIVRNARSIKGSFGKVILPDLPDDLGWEVVYDDLKAGRDLDGDGKHDVTLVVKKTADRIE